MATDYTDLVSNAYTNYAGRTGDASGTKYWLDQLNSGSLTPENFNTTFSNAVTDTKSKNDQLVRDAYGNIGRTGINNSGTVNNSTIDKAGYDYWTNQLNSGTLDPSKFNSAFTTATADYNANNPSLDNSIDIFQPDLYSNSRNGLPQEYQNQLLQSIIPQLLKSTQNYRGDIDQSTKAAGELYGSTAKGAIDQGLKSILDDLANRHVLKGDVASDAISGASANIAKSEADKAYQTAMLAAGMKAEEPTLLAKIASLGTSSDSSNPGEPYYNLMQQML